MCTVHGRSREQRYVCGKKNNKHYYAINIINRYTRLADWDYVRSCVKTADPMPIFGNGDLMSYEDYDRVVEQSGAAGYI